MDMSSQSSTPERSTARRQVSELGFAAVSLAVLMPMLILLIAVFLLIGWALFQKTKVQDGCIVRAVGVQLQLAKKLTKLEKMNPKAEHLRRRRKIADAAYKKALALKDPEAIAATKAVVLIVKAQQAFLASKQIQILEEAGLLRKRARQEFASWSTREGLVENPMPSLTLPLAVRPTPTDSLSPNYVPLLDFERLQAQNYFFRADLFSGIPRWLRSVTPSLPSGRYDEQCGATLIKENRKWVPALTEVK